MPGKIPIRRVLSKLAGAHQQHRERHRPTGFGFAIADSIDYLDARHWDQLTAAKSFFLRRPYLKVLEEHRPENLSLRFAIIFKGRKPVAAVVMQILEVSADRLLKGTVTEKPEKPSIRQTWLPVMRKVSVHVRERILVCGNLLSWGCHGIAFAPDEDPAKLWPAVAEAIYRVRRAERLSGQTDFALIKDLAEVDAPGSESLKRFSYRPVETDPNMVLELSPEWRSYQDYLNNLDKKYRRSAQQILKKVESAGCQVETLSDVEAHGDRLHQLYLKVHANNAMRLVTLTPGFLPAIARASGKEFRCNVIRRGEELLGFVTTVHDGPTGIGWYIGFDRTAAMELPLYLRLLHAEIGDAISLGCRRLSLGRTALEPKARLGAKPEPMHVWVRHRVPVLNVALRKILEAIPHGEAPERNPFKADEAE